MPKWYLNYYDKWILREKVERIKIKLRKVWNRNGCLVLFQGFIRFVNIYMGGKTWVRGTDSMVDFTSFDIDVHL